MIPRGGRGRKLRRMRFPQGAWKGRKVTGGWYQKVAIPPQARPRQGERRVRRTATRCRVEIAEQGDSRASMLRHSNTNSAVTTPRFPVTILQSHPSSRNKLYDCMIVNKISKTLQCRKCCTIVSLTGRNCYLFGMVEV